MDDSAYFSYYGTLANQQNMLQDWQRTERYMQAIQSLDIQGRTVMDVGTGSGILSVFAAQQGAGKVFAVEASEAFRVAQKMVSSNGFDNVITVMHGKVEDVLGELDERVDVIISEPIGVLLFHERMFESYLMAREKLSVTTLLVPSRGRLHFCPFSEPLLHAEITQRCSFWLTRPKDFFNVSFGGLHEDALEEAFASPLIGYVDPGSVMSRQLCTESFDFATLSPTDLHAFEIACSWHVDATGLCYGLAGWFDVDLTDSVFLDTSPWSPRTHWHQCKLLFRVPIALNKGSVLEGKLLFRVNDQRSYDIEFVSQIVFQKWRLQDQQFWNITSTDTDIPKAPQFYQLFP